jgi:hypothetical chaperone protein
MPLFGYGSPMKRAGLEVPSRYFHDLATWSNINRMYEPRVIAELRQVRQEASEQTLLDRLLRVVNEQRGHTLAWRSRKRKLRCPARARPTSRCNGSRRTLPPPSVGPIWSAIQGNWPSASGARIQACLAQARLSQEDIDVVFLTGGSVRLAHVRKAITKAVPSARIVEGDTFGAVGKGLTLEALRRYGPKS